MVDLPSPDALTGLATLAVVTFIAAAVNAVAGGGTILTFPVLASILPPDPGRLVTANATSTIGLWPGSIASAWAYRDERVGLPPWSAWLLAPSVAGAVAGALLVVVLPPRLFDVCVPWLILLSATLFAVQPQISRIVSRPGAAGAAPPAGGGPDRPAVSRLGTAAALQFLVGLYGGYFGAGIGILMLAVLGLLGLGDIHRLNAVKNVLAMAINGTAAVLFAVGAQLPGAHDVSWPHAGIMAVAGVLGGFAGAAVARRLPAALVRRCVAAIGFALAAYYFLRSA